MYYLLISVTLGIRKTRPRRLGPHTTRCHSDRWQPASLATWLPPDVTNPPTSRGTFSAAHSWHCPIGSPGQTRRTTERALGPFSSSAMMAKPILGDCIMSIGGERLHEFQDRIVAATGSRPAAEYFQCWDIVASAVRAPGLRDGHSCRNSRYLRAHTPHPFQHINRFPVPSL
jgi:hypothetical protein